MTGTQAGTNAYGASCLDLDHVQMRRDPCKANLAFLSGLKDRFSALQSPLLRFLPSWIPNTPQITTKRSNLKGDHHWSLDPAALVVVSSKPVSRSIAKPEPRPKKEEKKPLNGKLATIVAVIKKAKGNQVLCTGNQIAGLFGQMNGEASRGPSSE